MAEVYDLLRTTDANWLLDDEMITKNSSPTSMTNGRNILKERVRDVFEFIQRALLEDIERESEEIEKRRHRLDNKQNQFRAILRRFENDVRALIVNEGNDTDEKWSTKLDASKSSDLSTSAISMTAAAGSRSSDRETAVYKEISVPNERQIFVGGLPANVNEMDLENVFSLYGMVVGVKVLPKIPGKNACAFIAFDSVDTVRGLLSSPPKFGHYWPGHARRLYVEAKCSTAMAELPDCNKIYVTNLPQGTRLVDVKEFFERYGKVVGAKMRFRRTSRSQRYYCAYVAFESEQVANRVASDRFLFFGHTHRRIYVKPALPKSSFGDLSH